MINVIAKNWIGNWNSGYDVALIANTNVFLENISCKITLVFVGKNVKCFKKSFQREIQCLGIGAYLLSVQKLLHLPGTKTGSLDAVFSDLDNFTAS